MTRVTLGAVALVAGLSGCATPAKEISFDPQTGSGVVAVPSNTNVWPSYNYNQAKALIQQRVGPNYEIIDEGEVVTGKQTTNSQQTSNDHTWGATTTTDVTEWRISYRKKPGATPSGGVLPGMQTTQQTQYMQGRGAAAAGMGSGVQTAGGIVPSVAPGGSGVYGAGSAGVYNIGGSRP